MHGDVTNAVAQGILNPIIELRLTAETDSDECKHLLLRGGFFKKKYTNLYNNPRLTSPDLKSLFPPCLLCHLSSS